MVVIFFPPMVLMVVGIPGLEDHWNFPKGGRLGLQDWDANQASIDPKSTSIDFFWHNKQIKGRGDVRNRRWEFCWIFIRLILNMRVQIGISG